jgi:cytoskeletal protein RodZ
MKNDAPSAGRADKTIAMKRVLAIVPAVVVASLIPVWAQQAATSTSSRQKSLADVAKAEEARRTAVKKPSKVYTNGSLKPDASSVVDPPPATPTNTSPATPATNATPSAPAAAAKPEVKDQAYWSGRMKDARDKVSRTQLFADSLQTRINSLWTDFVNRDDPAQKAKLYQDRTAALAELERVKKELDEQSKAITAIEDEARRAGVPPGWLRPGA